MGKYRLDLMGVLFRKERQKGSFEVESNFVEGGRSVIIIVWLGYLSRIAGPIIVKGSTPFCSASTYRFREWNGVSVWVNVPRWGMGRNGVS